MIYTNRQINSREYKLILKAAEFSNIVEEKILELSNTINLYLEQLDLDFEKSDKVEKRITWYIDTEDHLLYRKNNFLFRIRKENNNEYETTLKCRSPDRYISAGYDLSSPIKDVKIKFEEDITPPFYSKFSLSAKYQENLEPKFDTFQEILAIFPNIKSISIEPNKKLNKVNDFEAQENSYRLGKLITSEEDKINIDVNFWHLSNEKIPKIVELTFNYKAIEQEILNEMQLEVFQSSLIQNLYKFFLSLQNDNIIDTNTAQTKTEYAYNYNKQ